MIRACGCNKMLAISFESELLTETFSGKVTKLAKFLGPKWYLKLYDLAVTQILVDLCNENVFSLESLCYFFSNMSCDTGRIPTIQEYCSHRLDQVPYADDVKPDSCYERVENDQEKR